MAGSPAPRWDWGGAWLGLGSWAAWLTVLWAVVGPFVADAAPLPMRLGAAALGAGCAVALLGTRRARRTVRWAVVAATLALCWPATAAVLVQNA